jgi:zinc protease
LRPKRSAPVFACNVWIGAGSADEIPDNAGVAHVHEHMLFKGTERRDVGEIAHEVEASGGRINAFTSFDQTCYFVAMSSRFFDAGLDILADAIQNAAFDADELSRELEVIREEMKRTEDNPARTAGLKLFETAYDHHPYRRPVIGTEESVGSLTREDVYGFYQRHYVPDNAALVVTGDFEEEEARRQIEDQFGSWSADEASYTPPERTDEPEQTEFRGWTDARDLQQSHLRIGFHIPDALDEDIPALDLLGAAMGYGDASHLVQTLQRDKQWVRSISAKSYTPQDAGLFMVSASYQLDDDRSHEDVARAMFEEIFRFREMEVSTQDLERARTIIESQEIYGKQTVQGLAMKLGRYQMVTGDPAYEQEYYEDLREVEPSDIHDVARRYLTPEKASAVLMYPDDSVDGEVTPEDLGDEADEAAAIVRSEAIDSTIETDEDDFVRLELEDGPTLIVQEDPSVETFALRGLTLGGVRRESPEHNGINKLLSELMTRGTDSRGAEEISHEVESMAGSLSGLAGRNSSGLKMSGLSRFFEESFEIFADCLLNATIPDEEFQRAQRLQLQSIQGRREKLEAVSRDQFIDAFYAPHPYGRPKIGTAQTVAELTPEDVRAFHDELVHPEDLVVVAIGDIEAERAARLTERYFVRPESESGESPDLPDVPSHDEPEMVVGDLDKEQAHVVVGFDAPTLRSDDRYALKVLYALLSGQGGRLFYELRDRKSLAYSVRARTQLGLDASSFMVQIGTSPEKIEEAVEGIFDEIHKLRHGPIEENEVQRAQRFLLGNHDIGLQKNTSRALSVGLDELYDLGYKRSLDIGDDIQSVTADDIHDIAQTYLNPTSSVTSIVKPSDVDVADDLAVRTISNLDS